MSEAGLALIRRDGPGRVSEYLTLWNDRWARFSLPGGHVEPGETFRVCLVREVAEELGLTDGTDVWVAPEPIAPVCEYRAVSAAAGVVTLYQAALFAVDLLTPDAAERVHRNSACRWVTEPEIRQLACTSDGRPIASQVESVFELAGVIPRIISPR